MSAPRPTDAELAILHVLWDRGPSTVRAVHEILGRSKEVGYTAVLRTLQIMTEKGLVTRDERERSHVYQACYDRGTTRSSMLGDLLDKAFGGSLAAMVSQAIHSRKASPEELAELRRLLDDQVSK